LGFFYDWANSVSAYNSVSNFSYFYEALFSDGNHIFLFFGYNLKKNSALISFVTAAFSFQFYLALLSGIADYVVGNKNPS
jgi:hypothetical protein